MDKIVNWAEYRPLQFMNMLPSSRNYTVRPGDPLYGVVWEFYEFETSDTDNGSVVCLPDSCSDIIFVLNGNTDSCYALGSFLKSQSHLFCEQKTRIFGIRFVVGEFSKITDMPLDEFHAATVPLSDINRNSSMYYEELIESHSFEERVKIGILFVLDCIANGFDVPLMVSYAANKILMTHCEVRINAIADETGYTDRYLRKIFKRYIGVSPKVFSEIVRFQFSITDYLNRKKESLEDHAMNTGFYDLSHMSRAYLKLVGTTPGVFLGALSGSCAV